MASFGLRYTHDLTLKLLDIPVDVLTNILEEWLDIRTLCRIDSAVVGDMFSKERLHRCYSNPRFAAKYPLGITPDNIQWLATRQIKFYHYNVPVQKLLGDAGTNQELTISVLTEILKHARRLELRGASQTVAKTLATAYESSPNLKYLKFVDVHDLSILQRILSNPGALQVLFISCIIQTDWFSQYFPSGFSLPQLKSLEIHTTNWTEEAASKLIQACPNLECIDIYDGDRYKAGALRGCQAKIVMLHLVWEPNWNFASVLASMNNLQHLLLDIYGPDDTSTQIISEIVQNCPYLRSLDIECIQVFDEGLQLIAEKFGSQLEKLSVSIDSDLVTSMGIIAIADNCPNLRSIRLSIDLSGPLLLVAFYTLLKSCHFLEEITLDGKGLESVDEVLHAMSIHCPKLRFLDIYAHKAVDYWDGLLHVVHSCPNLQYVFARKIPSEHAELLLKYWKLHRPLLKIMHQCGRYLRCTYPNSMAATWDMSG